MLDFDTALEQYLDHIKQDYAGWSNRASGPDTTEIRARMTDEFINGVRFEQGRKYVKVITQNSVHSFIVVKQDQRWAAGDILKAASWASPATNFSRGNILHPTTYQNRVSWTGAV